MKRAKTSRSPCPFWPLWFRALGSVWCAAFLIGTLAVILIASTSLESWLGTPRAQRLVYQTRWFDAFLALLALNIAASTVLRWPFKKKHVGFIITHIGLLLLMGGSLASRLLSVEGQMVLFEDEQSGRIAVDRTEIAVGRGRDGRESYPLEELREGKPFAALDDGTELILSEFDESAVVESSIEDGGSEPNPAIRLKLQSKMAGFGESFWLVQRDPSDPESAVRAIGPASLELRAGEPPAEGETGAAADEKPRLVFHRGAETLAEVPVDPIPGEPVAVGSTGYRLRSVRYWPDARVGDNNKLVSVSDKPLNPAVEAELVAPDGGIVRLVRFTHFPDFESMHGKSGAARPGFDVELAAGAAQKAPSMPTLSFYAGRQWQFRFHSMKGGVSGGVIEEGKTYPAGWMDFQFSVERLIERAAPKFTVRPVANSKGQPAVRLALLKNGRIVGESWATADRPLAGPDGRPLRVILQKRERPLPFSLRLRDFRKVDYPGTSRAESFESDVTLDDPGEGLSLARTIKMNKPLDYKGFRIFQSSYIQDPNQGEASVFTVAKNPGVPFIYAGAVILFLGVFITFFIPSLSSLTAFKHEDLR